MRDQNVYICVNPECIKKSSKGTYEGLKRNGMVDEWSTDGRSKGTYKGLKPRSKGGSSVDEHTWRRSHAWRRPFKDTYKGLKSGNKEHVSAEANPRSAY